MSASDFAGNISGFYPRKEVTMKKISILALGVLVLGLVIWGVPLKEGFSRERERITRAVAVLHPTKGNSVRGIVTFTKEKGGIMVVADIEGLTPGKHGFHIHEYGDCSAPDGTSAGGHFNPEGKPHGAPTSQNRHVGDLGNIPANAEGKAHYEWTDPVMTFTGTRSIIGRAIIVHADEDDLKSQPTGNAGPRIACGVIGIAKD
jgi:Cu-Zn family superoxide dismutase